jgi:hypothetical protein
VLCEADPLGAQRRHVEVVGERVTRGEPDGLAR